jgi:hypothetical protein
LPAVNFFRGKLARLRNTRVHVIFVGNISFLKRFIYGYCHSGLEPESRGNGYWIPACAGMTG